MALYVPTEGRASLTARFCTVDAGVAGVAVVPLVLLVSAGAGAELVELL